MMKKSIQDLILAVIVKTPGNLVTMKFSLLILLLILIPGQLHHQIKTQEFISGILLIPAVDLEILLT